MVIRRRQHLCYGLSHVWKRCITWMILTETMRHVVSFRMGARHLIIRRTLWTFLTPGGQLAPAQRASIYALQPSREFIQHTVAGSKQVWRTTIPDLVLAQR